MNIDFVNVNGQASGEVAAKVSGGLNANQMRPYINKNGQPVIIVFKGGDPKKPENYTTIPVTNGTLRRDEWKMLDEAVLRVADSRLVAIQDLIGAGLTYNLGDGMGTTVLEHHTQSDAFAAELSMTGITRSKNDRVTYTTHYLPIPIIHVDYEINARTLAVSRKMGNPLDTTHAERAARKVSEKLESLLFTTSGNQYTFGGGYIYSYLNHPDRNTYTMTNSWTDSAITPKAIVDQILAMKQLAITAKHFGPYMVYIPTAYETVIDGDYEDTGTTATGKTIRERILAIGGINGIKVVDSLPTDNVLLVQMTSDVVRLVRGMGITNVEWQGHGNMVTNYKVMTIQVPQIRSDDDGNSGIVHGSHS